MCAILKQYIKYLVMKISPEYLAGLIDGEGCLSIQAHKKQNSFGLRLTIALNTPLILIELHKEHKGTVWVEKETSKRYTITRWQTNGINAAKVIKLVYPHLIIKKKQAEMCLEFFEWYSALPKSSPGQKGRTGNGSSVMLKAQSYATLVRLLKVPVT